MKPRVFIETTIPSYLTAWTSADLVRAAHQKLTKAWWIEREKYELYTSRLVLQECEAGDPTAAAERMAAIAGIPLLQQSDAVADLAVALVRSVPLPPKAISDSLHIATAAVHGIQYLLTWNCTHIANVTLRPRIESVCRDSGYEPPLICTPEELNDGG
jgi:predicted nucleic acid-binding protein